jgi:hemoglobin-like flavoprotein
MPLAASLDRILQSQALLGERFYARFFAAVPAARKYFEAIDMRRQALVLTMALTVIQQHYDHDYPATRDFLHYLGSKHHNRRIPIELYNEWRQVMLDTLAEFHGDDWQTDLASQWGLAIDEAVDAMMAGYSNHMSV